MDPSDKLDQPLDKLIAQSRRKAGAKAKASAKGTKAIAKAGSKTGAQTRGRNAQNAPKRAAAGQKQQQQQSAPRRQPTRQTVCFSLSTVTSHLHEISRASNVRQTRSRLELPRTSVSDWIRLLPSSAAPVSSDLSRLEHLDEISSQLSPLHSAAQQASREMQHQHQPRHSLVRVPDPRRLSVCRSRINPS